MSDLESLLASGLTDHCTRLALADALQEAGRTDEADLAANMAYTLVVHDGKLRATDGRNAFMVTRSLHDAERT